METYKITIERVSNDKSITFFLSSIDDMFSPETYKNKISDAKTGEEFSIRQRVLNNLGLTEDELGGEKILNQSGL